MYKRKLLVDEVNLIPSELRDVFDLYKNEGFEIFLVGGGVRNILVGKVPVNSDLTTNATPEESLKILKKHDPFYENDFGTVSFKLKVGDHDELFEITTYRSEKEYSDFRRPDEVVWGKSLEEDVQRRDFTINAVVIGKGEKSTDYELIDYFDGLTDFEKGLIKAVGDAEKRFTEDALRMLRAIRFASILGFTIEEKTLEAIKNKSVLLEKISKERVNQELTKILESSYPADGVWMMISTGLMEQVIPELMESKGVRQGGHHRLSVLEHSIESLKNCSAPGVIVRLASLLHDVGKPRTQRFKCRKCGKMYKGLSEEMYKCEVCGFDQPTTKMITFYGHEVVGARMTEAIATRLRFGKKEIEKLTLLVRQHMFHYQPEMTDAAIRRLIRKIGKENIAEMMLLRIADRKGGGSKTTSWRMMELQKRIGEQLYEPMEVRDLAINGLDVMKILDVSAGPVIGKTLNLLFEEVIEDTSKNNREYLEKRVKEINLG